MDSIIGDDIICSVRGAVQHIVQLAADPDAQESLMAMDGKKMYKVNDWIGLLDNLIMYMQMEDEDIRLAAAHAVEFLSTNIKIKKELADNDALIKVMVCSMVYSFIFLEFSLLVRKWKSKENRWWLLPEHSQIYESFDHAVFKSWCL